MNLILPDSISLMILEKNNIRCDDMDLPWKAKLGQEAELSMYILRFSTCLLQSESARQGMEIFMILARHKANIISRFPPRACDLPYRIFRQIFTVIYGFFFSCGA